MLSAVITVINWMEGNIFLSCCFGISSEHCLIGGLGLGSEGFFWISCPRCEKMDLKIIQSLLERVKIHRNAGKPKNLWYLKDFSDSLTVQDKQGTYEQLSLNKNRAVDYSGNNTVLRIKRM